MVFVLLLLLLFFMGTVALWTSAAKVERTGLRTGLRILGMVGMVVFGLLLLVVILVGGMGGS